MYEYLYWILYKRYRKSYLGFVCQIYSLKIYFFFFLEMQIVYMYSTDWKQLTLRDFCIDILTYVKIYTINY